MKRNQTAKSGTSGQRGSDAGQFGTPKNQAGVTKSSQKSLKRGMGNGAFVKYSGEKNQSSSKRDLNQNEKRPSSINTPEALEENQNGLMLATSSQQQEPVVSVSPTSCQESKEMFTPLRKMPTESKIEPGSASQAMMYRTQPLNFNACKSVKNGASSTYSSVYMPQFSVAAS